MEKLDEFKSFVRTKPNLASFVTNGDMTWQKFYELYDLYGDNDEVWSKYTKDTNRSSMNISDGIEKISSLVKNIDAESIKSHINTAQKAIDFVQDLTAKKGIDAGNLAHNLSKGPASPRPLNKFFED